MRKFHIVAASAFVFATAVVAPAFGEETKLMAMLSGSEEVPPVETGGTGSADITWNSDTKELSWTIDFAGLSGPVAAAHFHGPAAPGSNAGVLVPISDVESPSEGTATLTDEQAAQIAEGMWYV
ncbi:MAG: CHRD domain-containing protein, partial [Hyphomicrobium sp.]|nr:CHRD domain-containing protein [Hyphomicrobium sp.]